MEFPLPWAIGIHDNLSWMLMIIFFAGHIGLHPEEKRLRDISAIQYSLHWLFSFCEPLILKLVDYLFSSKTFTGTKWGQIILLLIAKASWALPHGIVITTEAAERMIDFITKNEGPKGAHFAIGPCVCQRSMNRYKEPVIKDIFLLYAADIFMSLKRGFRLISAEELKGKLREFHKIGLVHELDFCMHSGKWTFCICNCEKDICAVTRAYLLTGELLWAGPEVATCDLTLCVGVDKCGTCIDRCIFDAIPVVDGKASIDYEKCMGCGLCVSTCPGKARKMVKRKDYGHQHQVPAEILLGETG